MENNFHRPSIFDSQKQAGPPAKLPTAHFSSSMKIKKQLGPMNHLFMKNKSAARKSLINRTAWSNIPVIFTGCANHRNQGLSSRRCKPVIFTREYINQSKNLQPPSKISREVKEELSCVEIQQLKIFSHA
ncbi:hypothetical protein Drorol1_Dr00012422 [Drosera rotundifolia]